MTDTKIQQALGGSPGSVLVKLVLVSLLVGVVLAAFGMTPWGFFHFIHETFVDIFGSGIEALHRIAGYAVSGAIIVVPIWLLMRVLSARKTG